MAITQTLLASAIDSTDLTVYTTASQTPTGNELILACITGRTVNASDSGAPTLVGNGVTWTQIGSLLSATRNRITLFRGMVASPSTGTVVITFSEDQNDCSWIFTEFAGVDTSGTHGSGAVRSVTTNQEASASSITVTLATFDNVANGTFGFFAKGSATSWNPGTGFTEIDDHGAGVTLGAQCQWRDDNDTSVDASTAGASTLDAIALEIIAAAVTNVSGAHGKMGFMF